jgi:FdhD protein
MASVEVPIVRVRDGQRRPALDRAAAEEPLEIRVHDRSFAVIMRTPGHDCELAAGFLLAERIIATPDDLGAIELCRDAENVVNVTLANAARDRLDRIAADRRELVANSSCGVCGRKTIESLRANLAAVPPGFQMPGAWIGSLPERLRAAQPVFAATGGLHAAALFKDPGAPVASAEDGPSQRGGQDHRPHDHARRAAAVGRGALRQRTDVVRDRPEGVVRAGRSSRPCPRRRALQSPRPRRRDHARRLRAGR